MDTTRTTLEATKIYIEIMAGSKALAPEQAQEFVAREFDSEAWFFLEQPTRFLAETLPLPDGWHKHCLSCVIFDRNKELRLEPQDDGKLCCRILREGEGEKEVFARRTLYLLRKHQATANMFRTGKTRIQYCEYFGIDEDGMPVLHASRLSGII